MTCTECKGSGTAHYGDEVLPCAACYGSGMVPQNVQYNRVYEFPPRTDGWEWGDPDDD